MEGGVPYTSIQSGGWHEGGDSSSENGTLAGLPH